MSNPFQRGDGVEIAERLLWTIDDNRANLVSDEGDIYHYENGVWLKAPVTQLKTLMYAFAGSYVVETPNRRLRINDDTVKGALNIARAMIEEEGAFSEAPVGLTFKNGFLEVSSTGARLVRHSREQKQRVGYAFNWREGARSEAFESFIFSFFKNDADATEKVAFIQELFGASLIGLATKFQKCAVFLGDGENGKDTLLDVLQTVFPEDTVCAIGPHDWGREYYRAALVGQKLNVIGELPKKDLDEGESFKAVVTGTKISGRETYGHLFFFRPVAGHIFAANNAMGSSDFSHGFYRRFGVVTFNRVFVGEEKDINIATKMALEKEAIVQWMVEGAIRLMKNGAYTLPASHSQELQAWKLQSDNVAAFCEELAPDGETRATALYNAYRTWAEQNGHKACSSTKFGVRLKKLLKERGWGEVRRDALGAVYPVKPLRLLSSGPTPKIPNPFPSLS